MIDFKENTSVYVTFFCELTKNVTFLKLIIEQFKWKDNKNEYEFIWKDLNEIKRVHAANYTVSIYQIKSLFDNKLNEFKGLKYLDQLNKEVM